MLTETSHGTDLATVGAGLAAGDSIRWAPRVQVAKYEPNAVAWLTAHLGRSPLGVDYEAASITPYEVIERDGNLLVTAGLQRLTNLLIGAGGQALTNTAARLGVGNSSAAAAVGQTNLQAAAGSTNRWFQPMDATYPTAVDGVVTLRSTFASADGNFVWAEWGSDIGTPTVTASAVVSATLLNRAVQALGTKASGSSWVLTATITVS